MADPSPLSEVTTVGIATAVASEINTPVAGTVWSQTGFVCARKWLPVYTAFELETLRIAVIAVSEEDERISRKHVARKHMVELWVQKSVPPKPADYESLVDAYAAFVFQLKDYWIAKNRVLAAYPKVNPLMAKVRANVSPKDLDEKQMYVGVVELTFKETTEQ